MKIEKFYAAYRNQQVTDWHSNEVFLAVYESMEALNADKEDAKKNGYKSKSPLFGSVIVKEVGGIRVDGTVLVLGPFHKLHS